MRQRSARKRVVQVLEAILFVSFVVFGAKTLADGVSKAFETRAFLAKSAAADGVVVRVDEVAEQRTRGTGNSKHTEDVTVYYPVVQFTAADGQVVEFTSETGAADSPDYGLGEAVPVRYDPSNPDQAKIDSQLGLWSPAVGSIIFGLVVLLCTFSAARPWRAFRARSRPEHATTSENGEPPPGAAPSPAPDARVREEDVAAAPTPPRSEEVGRPGDRGDQQAPAPPWGTPDEGQQATTTPPWGDRLEDPRPGSPRARPETPSTAGDSDVPPWGTAPSPARSRGLRLPRSRGAWAWLATAGLTVGVVTWALVASHPSPGTHAVAGVPSAQQPVPSVDRILPSVDRIPPSVHGILTSVDNLKPGNCVDTRQVGSQGEVPTVAVVACSTAHDQEVMGIAVLPKGPWRGQDTVDNASYDACNKIFRSYVGISAENSMFVLGVYSLTQEDWSAGRRSVICVVDDLKNATGSIKGARR